MEVKKIQIILKWVNRIVASLGLIIIGLTLTVLLFKNEIGDGSKEFMPVYSLILGGIVGV